MPSYHDIKGMHYLAACLKEAQRFSLFIFGIPREATVFTTFRSPRFD